MPDAPSPAPRRAGQTFGQYTRILLYLCLLVTLAYVGIYALNMWKTNADLQATLSQTAASSGLVTPAEKHLAPKFTDAKGRLLADPPSDPTQLADPDTLVVAHIDGTEENPGTSWKSFEAHLAQITGKNVSDEIYDNSGDDVAKIAAGKITIVAAHAADAPYLVNNYGFQPVAVLGDNSGANGNHLDIIVPVGSPITATADLKGHTLECTDFSLVRTIDDSFDPRFDAKRPKDALTN